MERELGRRPGYLAKICQNIEAATLDSLLEILERLGIDSDPFFHRALDLPPRPEMALDRLAQRLPRGSVNSRRRLRRLERRFIQMANELPAANPPPLSGRPTAGWEPLLGQVAACRWPKERRRLLRSARFHHPSFLDAYLSRLEQRGDDPPYELASTTFFLLLNILPGLPADPERQALLCRCLGLWGMCQTRVGRTRVGISAMRRALQMARRENYDPCCAELLRHGATVLEEHSEEQEALALLDEAQLLSMDLDLQGTMEHIARRRRWLRLRIAEAATRHRDEAIDPGRPVEPR
jgi:hypothetical protein